MKTYILDIIPKIARYGDKKDLETFIFNKSWVLVDEDSNLKIVYRFRQKNDEILISVDGNATRGRWEFLEDGKSIIIEVGQETKIFKHGFIDDTVLALKLYNDKSEYVIFFNDDAYDKIGDNSLNTIKEYLQDKYKVGLVKKIKSNDMFSKTFPTHYSGPVIVSETFNQENYPELENVLEVINKKISYINTTDHAAQIIIDYSEKRSIAADLSKYNKELLNLLNNQKLPIALLDKLFSEHKFKHEFLSKFKEYLKSRIGSN
jgi:hypothetical protein